VNGRGSVTLARQWRPLGLLAMSLCLLVISGRAAATAIRGTRVEIGCVSARSFVADLWPANAIVVVPGQRYRLSARPTSFGLRYVSDQVALALDQDRAVLIGAAGGPYRGCKVSRPPRRLASP
jgi:hypothetical protein